jgi:protocatechuate 3,4-dioxygenase alpha subunit
VTEPKTEAAHGHAGGARARPDGLTPSQTVGPFFLDGLLRPDTRRNVLVVPETSGVRIRIEGRVLDGDGAPVPDALIEVWQADADGHYCQPDDASVIPGNVPVFIGFGRAGTDNAGTFWFETIKPGAVPYDGDSTQAPHIGVIVGARGLLNHLVTRLYFADEPANERDPVLARVPAERRGTLLGRPETAGGQVVYRWDIILQGVGETAFFNV